MLDRGPLVYMLLWALAGAAVGYYVLLLLLLCRETVMMCNDGKHEKKWERFFYTFCRCNFRVGLGGEMCHGNR